MSVKTEPQEIRFIAKSAKEAAEVVRERLGEQGRVTSVRQVTGSGLQRFLMSPRLEIVAKSVPVTPAVKPLPPVAAAPAPQPAADPVAAASSAAPPADRLGAISCERMLARAGFSPELMARLDGAARWRELGQLPASEGFARAVAWLREYQASSQPIEAKRVAFIGSAGSGKTTSLCKYLAREVFLRGNAPEVLRLEVDKPHMDNGLSLYCDILGVPCHEDPSQVESAAHVLVDVPGFSLNEPREKERLQQALDALRVDHRIMVMNAAYDSSLLQRMAREGELLGADYRVYTHLDELSDVSHLWGCILDPQTPTLFMANGQNVAGDVVEDSFGYLIERTFPQ